MDFLVSYTDGDQDWADWIEDQLLEAGVSCRRQEPPTALDADPLEAVDAELNAGGNVILLTSVGFDEALNASAAPVEGRCGGPGGLVLVEIEPITLPACLDHGHRVDLDLAADDFDATRELLLEALAEVEANRKRPVMPPPPTPKAGAIPVPVGVPTAPPPFPTGSATTPPPPTSRSAPSEPAPADPTAADLFHPGDAAGSFGSRIEPMQANPVGDLRSGSDSSQRPAPTPPASSKPLRSVVVELPRIWNVPFERAPHFFDRDDLLGRLGLELDGYNDPSTSMAAGARQTDLRDGAPTSLQVLVGGSGSGKTAVAVEHAFRNAERLDLVWWLRARHPGTLLADLESLAGELGLSGSEPPRVRVRNWLEQSPKPWLLIVDDLDDWSDLSEVLPRTGRGQVLVTSGNRRLRSEGDLYDVTGFDDAGATSFLLDRTGSSDRDGARSVANRLGGLPLVLEVAGAYIQRTGVEFSTYLELLTDGALPEILPDVAPATVIEQVVSTTLAAVEQAAPNSAALSIALASLAPEPIPRRLLARLDTESEIVYVRVLQAMSLVSGCESSVSMHPLVQEALTELRAPESAEQSARFLLELLDQELAAETDLEPVASHVLATLAEADRHGLDAPSRARLGVRAAGWLDQAGQRDAALALGRDALSRCERSLPAGNAVTRAAREQLTALLMDVGEVREAIELQIETLAEIEASADGDPMPVLQAKAALAADCESIGNHNRAIEFGESAALELSRLVGDEHPDARAARSVLARSYEAVGRVDDAAGLRGESIAPSAQAALRNARSGPPAPPSPPPPGGDRGTPPSPTGPARPRDVIGSPPPPAPPGPAGAQRPPVPMAPRTDTGPVNPPVPPAPQVQAPRSPGSPERVEPGLADGRSEVDRLRLQFGPDHPETLAARDALASAYAAAGDHQEAISQQQGILSDCERIFGPDHPDTLTARNNLASSLADAGDYRQAVELQERVLKEHEAVLGPDDPQTLVARNNLANSYAAIGDHGAALDLQQRVADDYERTLGSEHPNTLTALHNLANSYADSGRHQEALELRERVLADRERILGPDHPQTLGARNNLANSYAEASRHDEALGLRKTVLDDRVRILGTDHPQTLGARNNLANSYAETGHHDEALALRQKVLDDRVRILGADHPHTLTARNNLANSLAGMGRNDEAMKLREQALADCERILGADHPHTLTARNNLANSYAEAGDRAKAAELRTQVLADRERLLGIPPAGDRRNRPTAAPVGLSGRDDKARRRESPRQDDGHEPSRKKRLWSRKA